jgi:hypothetical protein
MIRSLPAFTTLVDQFPDKIRFPTKTLLDSFGGEVRANLNDAINTCAIRLSYALNKAGAPIRPAPHIHLFKGKPHLVEATARHVRPTMASDLYLFRATDVKKYLIQNPDVL